MPFDAHAPIVVSLQGVPHRPVIINPPVEARAECPHVGPGVVVGEIWFGGMRIGLRVRHTETGIYARVLPGWVPDAPPACNVIQGPWRRA